MRIYETLENVKMEALHACRVEADRVGNSDTNGAHRMTVQRQRHDGK